MAYYVWSKQDLVLAKFEGRTLVLLETLFGQRVDIDLIQKMATLGGNSANGGSYTTFTLIRYEDSHGRLQQLAIPYHQTLHLQLERLYGSELSNYRNWWKGNAPDNRGEPIRDIILLLSGVALFVPLWLFPYEAVPEFVNNFIFDGIGEGAFLALLNQVGISGFWLGLVFEV